MPQSTEVEIAVLKEQVRQLKEAVDELTETTKILTDALNQSKGGWMVLVTLASVATTVGGLLGWVISTFGSKGG